MSVCDDPNRPSYDPATRLDDTARKVIWLCENAWDRMTQWERDFCQSVYGASPLSRKQHIRVWALHKQYSSNVRSPAEGREQRAVDGARLTADQARVLGRAMRGRGRCGR